MKAAKMLVITTALASALFAIIPPTTLAAERNTLEHRTKFIIYDNKYEIINAQKFDINIANDANNERQRGSEPHRASERGKSERAQQVNEMKWGSLAACFVYQMCSNNF